MLSTNPWKKTRFCQAKTLKAIIAQENHSQLAIVKTDYYPLILKNFVDDHQIDETHKTLHKTDIIDEIVKTISTETIILDQTPIEVTTLTIIEIFYTQIPGRYYFNDRSRNFSNNRNWNHLNNRNRNWSNKRSQNYSNKRPCNKNNNNRYRDNSRSRRNNSCQNRWKKLLSVGILKQFTIFKSAKSKLLKNTKT